MNERKPFLQPVGGREHPRDPNEVTAELTPVLGAINGYTVSVGETDSADRAESRIERLVSEGRSQHPFLARLAMQKLRELGDTGSIDRVTVRPGTSEIQPESPLVD